VYLVDFGLVRLRGADRTSRIFGTAPFMAPESLARGEYSPATDRYTLGATVYYALTGEAPIPGDVQGMTQRLTAALGPGKDREARGILAMLAPQPDARPASAARWVRALRAAPPQTTASPGQISAPPTTAASPSGYRLPPGSFTGTFAGPPPQPVSYPMPPGSLSGPRLSPAAGGYIGAAPPKKSGAKVPLIVLGAVLLLVVGCCSFTVYKLGSSASRSSGQPGSSGGRPGAGPTRSFDKSKPPPPVTELRSALVSVGDIAAVMSTPPNSVQTRSDQSWLQGGLSSLKMCADGAVAGDAIAGAETNTFKATSAQGYPFVSSAVAGFYGDEAKVYFAALRDKAGRCGWSELRTAKLGEDTLGVFTDNADSKVAIVFVRRGQVVIEVAVTGAAFLDTHPSYQSDAIRLATAMAKRLPKSGP
jgi:hypothetical protein